MTHDIILDRLLENEAIKWLEREYNDAVAHGRS